MAWNVHGSGGSGAFEEEIPLLNLGTLVFTALYGASAEFCAKADKSRKNNAGKIEKRNFKVDYGWATSLRTNESHKTSFNEYHESLINLEDVSTWLVSFILLSSFAHLPVLFLFWSPLLPFFYFPPLSINPAVINWGGRGGAGRGRKIRKGKSRKWSFNTRKSRSQQLHEILITYYKIKSHEG